MATGQRTVMPRTGASATRTARDLGHAHMVGRQAVSSTSRGRRLTGKPVTESSLSPCASVRVLAMGGCEPSLAEAIDRTDPGVLRPASEEQSACFFHPQSIAQQDSPGEASSDPLLYITSIAGSLSRMRGAQTRQCSSRAGRGTRQCLIWLEILEVFVCSAINDWKVPRYLG
jgi:hypothetical protein